MKKTNKKLNKKFLLLALIILILILLTLKIVFNNKNNSSDTEFREFATVITATPIPSNNNSYINNVVNSNGNTYKDVSYTYSTFLSTNLINNNLYVKISPAAKDIILFDSMNVNLDEEYLVSKINKDIKNVFIGHFNSLTDYPVLFIIYTDNTAQYVDIEKSFNSGKFSIDGDIEIDNIDYFINVDVTKTDSTNCIGVIAITKNNIAYEITPSMINR